MQIPKVSTSAYDSAEPTLQELLDTLADAIRQSGNWKVRKKTFLDIIDELQLMYELDPEQLPDEELEDLVGDFDLPEPDRSGDDPQDAAHAADPPDSRVNGHSVLKPAEADGPTEREPIQAAEPLADGADDPDGMGFPEVLPLYVGALLERLAETEIRCAEQAAIYILSIHREHQEAAEGWLKADHRNAKAFRKLLRADRRLTGVLDMMEEYFGEIRTGRALPPEEG